MSQSLANYLPHIAIFISLVSALISWRNFDTSLRISAQQSAIPAITEILVSLDDYGVALGAKVKNRGAHNLEELRHKYFVIRRNLEVLKLTVANDLLIDIEELQNSVSIIHSNYNEGEKREKITIMFQSLRKSVFELRDKMRSRIKSRSLF